MAWIKAMGGGGSDVDYYVYQLVNDGSTGGSWNYHAYKWHIHNNTKTLVSSYDGNASNSVLLDDEMCTIGQSSYNYRYIQPKTNYLSKSFLMSYTGVAQEINYTTGKVTMYVSGASSADMLFVENPYYRDWKNL